MIGFQFLWSVRETFPHKGGHLLRLKEDISAQRGDISGGKWPNFYVAHFGDVSGRSGDIWKAKKCAVPDSLLKVSSFIYWEQISALHGVIFEALVKFFIEAQLEKNDLSQTSTVL